MSHKISQTTLITDVSSGTWYVAAEKLSRKDNNVGYSGIVPDVAWESEAGQAFLYLAYTFLAFRMGLSNARGNFREKIETFYQFASCTPQWRELSNPPFLFANNVPICKYINDVFKHTDETKNFELFYNITWKQICICNI